MTPSVLRQQCGAVMQDGFVFSNTIANHTAESDDCVNKTKSRTPFRWPIFKILSKACRFWPQQRHCGAGFGHQSGATSVKSAPTQTVAPVKPTPAPVKPTPKDVPSQYSTVALPPKKVEEPVKPKVEPKPEPKVEDKTFKVKIAATKKPEWFDDSKVSTLWKIKKIKEGVYSFHHGRF